MAQQMLGMHWFFLILPTSNLHNNQLHSTTCHHYCHYRCHSPSSLHHYPCQLLHLIHHWQANPHTWRGRRRANSALTMATRSECKDGRITGARNESDIGRVPGMRSQCADRQVAPLAKATCSEGKAQVASVQMGKSPCLQCAACAMTDLLEDLLPLWQLSSALTLPPFLTSPAVSRHAGCSPTIRGGSSTRRSPPIRVHHWISCIMSKQFLVYPLCFCPSFCWSIFFTWDSAWLAVLAWAFYWYRPIFSKVSFKTPLVTPLWRACQRTLALLEVM